MRVKITSDGDKTSVVDAATGEHLKATRVEFSAAVDELPRATVACIDVEAELECEAEIINGLERYVVRDGEVPFMVAVRHPQMSELSMRHLIEACQRASEKVGVPFMTIDNDLQLQVLCRPGSK